MALLLALVGQNNEEEAPPEQSNGGGAGKGYGAQYWRTVRKLRAQREERETLRELYTEVRAADPEPAEEARIEAVAPALKGLPPADTIDWAAIAAEAEQKLRAALEASWAAHLERLAVLEAEARRVAEIEQEDEELMLLLAA